MALRFHAFVAAAVLVAALAGCRRPSAEKEQREGPDRSDLAGRDAERQPIPPPPEPRFRVVESRGTCAPPADGVRSVSACCNDQPCRGECVTERGSEAVQCACFDEVGGCAEGEICCKRLGACMRPEACDWLP
jgi:hypothetical protein